MVERIAPEPNALVPQHLYKYRSLRGDAKTFARDLIVNQRLYFPTPSELNDPFEFRPVLDLKVTPEQKRAYIKRAVQALHGDKSRNERRQREKAMMESPSTNESIAQSFRMTMDRIGVFSLSARPLDVLMWPHYADNHAGICVRFDTMALVGAGYVPMFVTYCRERPISRPMIDEPIPTLEKAARTKGLPWAYEEEWRLLLNRGGGQVVTIAAPVISGVILGARISAGDRSEVLQWVSACPRPMEVIQAKFHESDYALESDRIAP